MRPSGSTTTNGSGACQNNPAPPPTLSTPTARGGALYHKSGGPGNFWTEEKGVDGPASTRTPLTFALRQQNGEAPARLCRQVQPSAVEATDVVRDGVVHCRTRARGGLLPREGTERLTKDIGLRLPARAGQTVDEPLGFRIQAKAQSHAIHTRTTGAFGGQATTGAGAARARCSRRPYASCRIPRSRPLEP